MGVSKNRGKTPKMDGENNGKPYEQMDDLGGCTHIFGSTPILWMLHQMDWFQKPPDRSVPLLVLSFAPVRMQSFARSSKAWRSQFDDVSVELVGKEHGMLFWHLL